MMQTKKSLTGIKGLSEAKVDKICEAAEKIIRRSVVKITTGSPALDELLAGGIETSSTREAFGEFRSGKTQLAHTLCVSTQLPLSMHGGNGKVAYIDTEGTFVPDRIVPIAELFGFGSVAVLENIIQSLAQMLSPMSKVAQEFNVAVCVTNQVIADPGGRLFILDPTKFAGGDVLAHARQPTVQLFSKGKGVERVCKVFDTRRVSESEASRSNRIVPTADSFGLDFGAVLENMIDSIASFQVFYCGRGELAERQVIDCIIASSHVEFSGRDELDERQGIDTYSITEAFGELRSVKAQLSHTSCASTEVII